MEITKNDLSVFVAKSDELGGPGHPATVNYWSGFRYKPSVIIDTTLPPDSDEYFQQMLNLYKEISGRQFDQKTNEFTQFNVDELVDLESPYAFQDSNNRLTHYLRLASPLYTANLVRDAAVLDMGCGWGLSSEFLAQMGFNVSAVDINPIFVDLVQRRAKRLGFRIKATESSFDEYLASPLSYDAVLFYECFHHAVNPKRLLTKIHGFLKQHGKLILVGEPIQDLWWPKWGLRLDPLSVYCIKKFGWFESGWSESYLMEILAVNNFLPLFYNHSDPMIGKFVIAEKRWRLGKNELANCALQHEWWIDDEWLASNRAGKTSTLMISKPQDARNIYFDMWNFSPANLDVLIKMDDIEKRVCLSNGANLVSLDCSSVDLRLSCSFTCAPWCPMECSNSDDSRYLGFHLKEIHYD